MINMTRRRASVLILIYFIALTSLFYVITARAERPNYVYDWEGILTENETLEIDTLCRDIDINTTVEIVIITLVSYDEPLKVADIDEARLDYFNDYELDGVAGIGKEDKDNGILIILSTAMADYGIEVGYGLEGDLTDGECGRIGRDIINKYYVDGGYLSMFYKAVEAIGEEIGYGEPDIIISPDDGDDTIGGSQIWDFIMMFLPSLLIIAIAVFVVKLLFSSATKSAKKRQDKQEEMIRRAIETAVNKFDRTTDRLEVRVTDLQRITEGHDRKLRPVEIVTETCPHCNDIRRSQMESKKEKERILYDWYWFITTITVMCLVCGTSHTVEKSRKKVESVKGRVKRLKKEKKERARLEALRRQEEKERREREEEDRRRREEEEEEERIRRRRYESSRSSDSGSSRSTFGGGGSGGAGASGRLG